MRCMLVAAAFFAMPLAAWAQEAHNGPVVGAVTLGVAVAEQDLLATGYRASKLLGSEVYNDRNERIGKVDDLVLAPDGRATFAVLDVGGFLGMGEHRVAIPMHQFRGLHPKLVLPNATKETLKALPEFTYIHHA